MAPEKFEEKCGLVGEWEQVSMMDQQNANS